MTQCQTASAAASRAWHRLGLRWRGSPSCALCSAPSHPGERLCAGCHADLPWLDHARCARCGDPAAAALASKDGTGSCDRCRREPPAFERLVTALGYRFPVDAMIRRLKFDGELWLVPVLAGLLLERCSDVPRPQCLVPVPLSDRRLAARGFNQSAELARVLAARLGIASRPQLLRRARDTPPQSGLPLSGRVANLRGAFVVDDPVQGLHVALVDDVATTGATGAEAAHALLRQGAARVDLWTVAHTLPGRQG
jgi:ComF family protein